MQWYNLVPFLLNRNPERIIILFISIVGIRRSPGTMELRLGGCCSACDETSLTVTLQADAGVTVSTAPLRLKGCFGVSSVNCSSAEYVCLGNLNLTGFWSGKTTRYFLSPPNAVGGQLLPSINVNWPQDGYFCRRPWREDANAQSFFRVASSGM